MISQSVSGAWSVTLELDTRALTVTVGRETIRRDHITRDEARRVRAIAARLHARGDLRYETQFSSGEDTFAVTLDGQLVKWVFIDETGGGGGEATPLYEWATLHLRVAKARSAAD